MFSTIRYILTSFKRDRVLLTLIIALFFAILGSMFMGSIALSEQRETGLVFIASTTRITLIAGMIIAICFYIRKLFDNREIELLLTLPINKLSLILGIYIAFVILALILSAILVLAIGAISSVWSTALLWWWCSLMLEMMIILAFAQFVSLLLHTPISAIMTAAGFYILSRMLGFFLYMIERPTSGELLGDNVVTRTILQSISAIMPRLDLFSQTSWLVYGEYQQHIAIIVLQVVIYVPLLLCATLIDFSRKRF